MTPGSGVAVLLYKQPQVILVGNIKAEALIKEKKTSFDIIGSATPTANQKIKGGRIKVDESSLSHTRWKCQYHIVLVPKYRRKAVYGKLRKDIGAILRRLCDYKHVEIIEAHAMPNHIHMLLSIPPSICVSEFMGYLKGKSTLMIFERHAQLKYKYGRRVFWAKGYYVSTVGGNKAAIQKYIQDQETEDMVSDQLTFKEYEDPFAHIAK